MIVASVIMAIAVVGLLSGLAGATRNAARLRDYDRVAQLARWRMSELVADTTLRPGAGVSGFFESAVTGGMEAGWQGRVTSMEAPPHPPMPGELVLDRILLEVWWMNGDNRRTFRMETVRQRLVRPGDRE
jgi:hypothetical protein